jgi:hypothetical protein
VCEREIQVRKEVSGSQCQLCHAFNAVFIQALNVECAVDTMALRGPTCCPQSGRRSSRSTTSSSSNEHSTRGDSRPCARGFSIRTHSKPSTLDTLWKSHPSPAHDTLDQNYAVTRFAEWPEIRGYRPPMVNQYKCMLNQSRARLWKIDELGSGG